MPALLIECERAFTALAKVRLSEMPGSSDAV
jgi:hypothetical protein